MPPRVFASRRFPARVREELERSFELDVHDSEWPPSREELLARAAGKAGLMTMPADRVDDALLDAAGPQLRVVANFAVGYDNVDLEAVTRRGVIVSNTPAVLTEATAEMAIALMLARTGWPSSIRAARAGSRSRSCSRPQTSSRCTCR